MRLLTALSPQGAFTCGVGACLVLLGCSSDDGTSELAKEQSTANAFKLSSAELKKSVHSKPSDPISNIPGRSKTAEKQKQNQEKKRDSALSGASPQFNPYHSERIWKVWSLDEWDPADKANDFQLTPQEKRVYPTQQSGLTFAKSPSEYAGAWDDVYVSQDNFHSRINSFWQDQGQGKVSIAGQVPVIKRSHTDFRLARWGTTFSSQSTTGMGHDIANQSERVLTTEKEYYFQNIVRAGPAHISFRDLASGKSEDKYQALIPCMFNSVGSSGSETWALTKMAIAGANLKTNLKARIKERGLYAATLLYLWKAALPIQVPYEHEFRHRVAYFADGLDRHGRGRKQTDLREDVFKYDDSKHLMNMISLARQLEFAPPVSIVSVKSITGGQLIYDHKTVVLAHQAKEDVRLVVTTDESYDIQNLPLKLSLAVINGTPATTIKEIAPDEYEIFVPYQEGLPAGRTSILVVAENGKSKSNPAVINIFRTQTGDNRRPQLQVAESLAVLPGETIELPVMAKDPDGHSVTLDFNFEIDAKWKDNTLVWKCPKNQEPGDLPIVFWGSDKLTGSSTGCAKTTIRVRRIVPTLDARQLARHHYEFSAERSRSTHPENVSFEWYLDNEPAVSEGQDGKLDADLQPIAKGRRFEHRFPSAGFYSVTLKAISGGESVTETEIVHCAHDWQSRWNNNWRGEDFKDLWRPLSDATEVRVVNRDGQSVLQVLVKKRSHQRKGAEFSRPLPVPCFIEVEFNRGHNIPGACLEFFGCAFGRANVGDSKQAKFVEDLSFSQRNELTNKFEVFNIGEQPKLPSRPSKLTLYVAKSGSNQIDLSGFFEADSGKNFFKFKNREMQTNQFAIISGEMGVQNILQFRVWSPDPAVD